MHSILIFYSLTLLSSHSVPVPQICVNDFGSIQIYVYLCMCGTCHKLMCGHTT